MALRCYPQHSHGTPPLRSSPPPRSRVRPAAGAAAAVQRTAHVLPDGVALELLHASPTVASTRSPLLFVHGSYHAAWCWSEHFLPFFAERGYDAYAVSLRCQGGSGGVPTGGVAGTLLSHAADVADVVSALPAPVVLGHSFGGLVVQEMLSSRSAPLSVAAAVLLCSVPPSGNSAMAGRMLRAAPLQALCLTYAFITRAFATDAALCRDTFFSAAMPESEVLQHMRSIASSGRDTRLLDVAKLGKSLPVPPQAAPGVPVCVMGSFADAVVDAAGVAETAAVWGVRPVMLSGLGHDLMLDTEWRVAAEALASWLDKLA